MENPTPTGASPEIHLVRPKSRRLVNATVGVVFFALITGVSWFLFGEPRLGGALFSDLQQSEERAKAYDVLTIAYDQPLTTYEPTASDLVSRGYLVNVYEGLVRFDRNMNVEPALALSWGMLNDTAWQFKLRPDVSFHNGSSFDARDVVASVERAQLDSIKEVQPVDDLTVHIFTKNPDPLLPNKLTLLSMVPSESPEVLKSPVGTGPYAFATREGEALTLNRFDDYWGPAPAFPTVQLVAVPDKFERYESFLAGDIDVLAQVPPIFVDPLLSQNYLIASQPSLEVNFLLFGSEDADSPFRHREVREAFRSLFDFTVLERLAGGFAHPAGQFVSRGILGYNPALDPVPYDVQKARGLLRALPAPALQVTVDLPEGLEAFGDYMKEQLVAAGFEPKIAFWPRAEYEARVASGESEVFFFGWRSDLGDAGDFFANVVKGRYPASGLDGLISDMEQNLLESLRTEQLQKLMALVVEEEILGIPLFETDVLVGLQPDLVWDPRVDNLILAVDFR